MDFPSTSFDADDLDRASLLGLLGIVEDRLVGRFDRVKSFLLFRMKKDRFSILLGHLEMTWIQFDAIIATDAFFSLKRDDDHEWFF